MPKPVNLIAACAENRVIGRGGRLPWRIAEDWEFFRRQTAGQTAILGRVSYLSWRSIFAEERRAIVVTRDSALADGRTLVAPSLAGALALAEDLPGEIYVCGGQRLYEEAIVLPRTARLYLTLVHAELDGDRFFPDWRSAFPRVVASREGRDANFRYTFLVLKRAEPASCSAAADQPHAAEPIHTQTH